MFTRLVALIRQVLGRLIPYKNIESVERIETPLSTEMANALDDWYHMYIDRASWLKPDSVKSMNLPAFISSEIARQIVLEMKWNISGGAGENGEDVTNPRAQYLHDEFEKLVNVLRQKLEQGCAAGGMTIKPYPKDGHIHFDWTMDWSLYPIAFDDTGNLSDVIFPDSFTEGKIVYTRLERHQMQRDGSLLITQRAFKSTMKDYIGTEIALTEVPQWASLQPEVTVHDVDGMMFGWYKVASANSIDVDSPMGISVFCKAKRLIKEADIQYSRLLWEYEGSELAIDVDPTVLKPRKDSKGNWEPPRLNERLFRAIDRNDDASYNVFSPAIRDTALVNGLNQILMRIEDQCGLARGTLSDVNEQARTATELVIMKRRSYDTIADNQAALERCLRDVVRAMDKYATLYNLAPEGEYEVSFEWDDSIITDTNQQLQERLLLLQNGLMGKTEFREWYFGETHAQADAAIKSITEEKLNEALDMQSMLPSLPDDTA